MEIPLIEILKINIAGIMITGVMIFAYRKEVREFFNKQFSIKVKP